jgi:ankyrin repeat protein
MSGNRNGLKRDPVRARSPSNGLHSASERGDISAMNQLLARRADINQRDQVRENQNLSPSMTSVRMGRLLYIVLARKVLPLLQLSY